MNRPTTRVHLAIGQLQQTTIPSQLVQQYLWVKGRACPHAKSRARKPEADASVIASSSSSTVVAMTCYFINIGNELLMISDSEAYIVLVERPLVGI